MLHFFDSLFQFQTYLSGVDGVGSQPLDERSYVFDIADIWDEYRGDGVTLAVAGPIDRLHPDLEANYDTSYLTEFDPLPLVQDSPSLVLPTFFAGLAGADDNGFGLVGVAPDLTFVPLIESAYNETDVIVTINNLVRTDTSLDAFEQAPFGRDGKGVIVVATSPAGSTLYDIGGNDGPTGDTNSEFALSGLRHVITTGALSAYSRPINGVLAGDMTLITTPVQTDASSTNNFDDVSTTLGLDPSGELGAIQAGETLGFWQVLAETEIGEDIDSENFYINISGIGAGSVASGAIALILEANEDLGWRDVQEILAYSAKQVGTPVGEVSVVFPAEINGARDWNGGGLVHSANNGFGVLDVHGAVRLAEVWQSTNTAENEIAQSVARQEALPSGTVAVQGSYRFTFDAATDMRIEHVTLNVDYFAQGGLLGQEADNYIIRIISPNGTVSDLTGEALVFAALNQSRLDQELSSRKFWGENADDGDGIWTVEFITDESNLNTQFFDVSLDFYGAAASADDVYFYTDDFAYAQEIGHDVTLADASGANTINAAAMQSDLHLTAVAGEAATANGATLYQLSGGSSISALIAGDGDDVLIGSSGAQELRGGRGADTISGGSGSDTYVSGLASSEINVVEDGSGIIITSAEGVDHIAGDVEFFRFSDQTLSGSMRWTGRIGSRLARAVIPLMAAMGAIWSALSRWKTRRAVWPRNTGWIWTLKPVSGSPVGRISISSAVSNASPRPSLQIAYGAMKMTMKSVPWAIMIG